MFLQRVEPAQEAVVIVSIADLLGQSMHSYLQKKNKKAPTQQEIIQAYESLPEIQGDDTNCLRIYQLLFNECAEVLDVKGCEVKLQVPYALYANSQNGKLSGVYWTLKKNIILKSDLGQKEYDHAIPQPFKGTSEKQKIAVLRKPYYDPVTALTFSAGTKFVTQSQLKDTYRVVRYSPKRKKIIMSTVPSHFFMQKDNDVERKKQQQQYVYLLREWAHNTLPPTYIWGGASYSSSKIKTPKTGLDCSGAIIRSSQACSIPFFYKNSSAMKFHLKNYEKGTIEDGDIIWFNGHVMVISSVKDNLIIESRGHASGFGKLHELPLSKLFKNIQTYNQLLTACQEKKPLELLDKDGKVSATIKTCKFLRYASVWDTLAQNKK